MVERTWVEEFVRSCTLLCVLSRSSRMLFSPMQLRYWSPRTCDMIAGADCFASKPQRPSLLSVLLLDHPKPASWFCSLSAARETLKKQESACFLCEHGL